MNSNLRDWDHSSGECLLPNHSAEKLSQQPTSGQKGSRLPQTRYCQHVAWVHLIQPRRDSSPEKALLNILTGFGLGFLFVFKQKKKKNTQKTTTKKPRPFQPRNVILFFLPGLKSHEGEGSAGCKELYSVHIYTTFVLLHFKSSESGKLESGFSLLKKLSGFCFSLSSHRSRFIE